MSALKGDGTDLGVRCQARHPFFAGLLLNLAQNGVDKTLDLLRHEAHRCIHGGMVLHTGVEQLVGAHAQCVEYDGVEFAQFTGRARADNLVEHANQAHGAVANLGGKSSVPPG